MKILVVDDEKLLVKGIKFNLENDGYEVVTGCDGMEAVELAASETPDLIVLDLMMPRLDGLEACTKIREFSQVPIIMLTAKSEDMDKLLGFEHGADDYLTKPFGMMEMVSRVRAVLRRCHADDKPQILRQGGLSVDPTARTVTADGAPVTLTYKEFELLCLFLQNPGTVFTRDRLFSEVWGESFVGETRTVDMHIRTLRQKLGTYGDRIETVRGVGYKLLPADVQV